MLFVKSFHIIFVVSYLAGLLYLPRLYVYHSLCIDKISYDRFLLMEKNLLFFIILPSFLITFVTGFVLFYFLFEKMIWIYVKIFFVFFLFLFNLICIYLFFLFKNKKNIYDDKFYRIFNEIPFVIFIIIVLLVVTRPF